LFRRRIGGVFIVVVEDDLREHAHKNSFHRRNNFRFSTTTMVKSQLAYPENVDFNLVQYFTANRFSIKEQKRYNGKYTHYTKTFPLETQTRKTNIFYIHS